MEAQVVKTAQTAWYHLYSISKIRPYLTTGQTSCVIHAYVTSRLDQNNSLLSGVPETTLLCKLQKVQNAAAKSGWEEAGPCDTIPSRTALAPRVPTSHLLNSFVGIQNTARRRPFVSEGFVEALLV